MEALREFGQKLGAEIDSVDPWMAAEALEEALENVGEVLDIRWQEEGCWIWFEPWEEMKLRQSKGESLPIVYRAGIGDNLEVASFECIEDESERARLKKKVLIRPLKASLQEFSFGIHDKAQAKEELEKKLSKIGRVINMEREQAGWLATIEPWEEMRIRNTKRGGKSPIVTEEIKINWKDGKLEFTPEEWDEDSAREEIVEVGENKT